MSTFDPKWEDTMFMDIEDHENIENGKYMIYLSDEGTVVNVHGNEVTNVSADSPCWMDDLEAEGSLEVEFFEEL